MKISPLAIGTKETAQAPRVSPSESPESALSKQNSAAVVVELGEEQSNSVTYDRFGALSSDETKESPTPSGELSEEEKEEVKELQERDQEVRRHEQAHKNALGPYAVGGISFQFTTGPDNKQYAVGGYIRVDTSPEATPEETERKMRTIRHAALAPQDPSSVDQQVAAQVGQEALKAQSEKRSETTQL